MPKNPGTRRRPRPARRARRYLTSSIPYVNAAPHVGFAMEMIQADCLARLYRLQGHDVRFQAGTDENSLKNVLAAEARGLPVAILVERHAAAFRVLREALELSFDDFIRTSTDERHRAGVARLWAACAANGDIYKRAYRGLYCTGCEQFYKPAELDGGRCPEHGTRPEEVAEDNWCFRLSRYGEAIRSLIASGALAILPEHRRNEVLAWCAQGLEDFSISRSAARARGWGLAVPGDPGQVIYVWFDALANYISALDYATDGASFARFWQGAAAREHVIGKGVLRFHAVYWPAMLLSAGLPPPSRILVHGYVTVAGRKIGKSAGNAVDPMPLAAALGADALRYYLLRHVRAGADGDFSPERHRQAYRSELAGQLGNLAHRVLGMIGRYAGGRVPAIAPGVECELVRLAERLPAEVAAEIERFAFHAALARIWLVVAAANRHVAETEPWRLARAAADDPAARAALDGALAALAAALAQIGRALAPLLPTTSRTLLAQLGAARVDAGALLFPRPDPASRGDDRPPRGRRHAQMC